MKLNEIRDLYDRARVEEMALFRKVCKEFASAGLRYFDTGVRIYDDGCVFGDTYTCVGAYKEAGKPLYRVVVIVNGDQSMELHLHAEDTLPGDLLKVVKIMERDIAFREEYPDVPVE